MGKGGGGGNLRCLDPWQVLYKPSLLGAKNEKTKRILMFEVTVFAYSKRMAFSDLLSDLRSLLFFCVKNAIFSRKCDPYYSFPFDSDSSNSNLEFH